MIAPAAVSSASGSKDSGKLPVLSLIRPSNEVAPPVPKCEIVLIAAIPPAAVAGESISVDKAQNGPLIA